MENTNSQTALIPSGKIEYSFTGGGPTILVSHGTLGGYDQGLAISRLFDQEKFRFLAVSRAGYLRSSASTGITPQDQAQSFAELLDHEGIPEVAVLGLSGGAPAAISFAQDYPHRCTALVLLSSITLAPPPLPLFFQLNVRMQNVTMRIDPLWALVYKYGLRLLIRSSGVQPNQVGPLLDDPLQREVIQGIFRPATTPSLRREGMHLDQVNIESLPAEPSYEVSLPTLICHAADDPLASPAAAEELAASIPGAKYLPFPDGGHVFFVVHHAQVIPHIEHFISAHLPG